jgi:O-antigen/teichoic acid export membrane protein
VASAVNRRDGKEKSLSDKIVRNVAFGGLRSLLVAPIPFLLTPLILSKIGAAGYGTWAIFLAINGMTSLTDLGLVGTLSKFVAEYYARRDYVALNRLLNTGLAVFGLLSLGIMLLFWVGSSPIIAALFHNSLVKGEYLQRLFRYFILAIGANVLIMLFSSVTAGVQRLDLTSLMTGFNTFCAAVLSAVLLLRGWGLSGLICGQVCAAILTLAGYLLLMRKLVPQISLNPFRSDASEAKRIFSFSLRLYFTQAAMAVHNHIEKLLLAFFVNVSAAGWYDIANDVALKIRGVISVVLGPVMPAASELGALKDNRRLVELYYRAQKYLAFVGVPTVCYVAAASGRFVHLWIGPRFKMLAVPLAVLVIVNFFNLITGPGFLILLGNGDLRPGMQSAVLGIILNISLSPLLIYKFGFPGAVVGTAISLVIAAAYFLYLFHTKTGNPVGRMLRESFVRPVLCSLAILGVLRVVHLSGEPSWFGLAAEGLAFGFVYVVVLLFSGFFDRYDWSKIESLLPAMRYARRIIPVA